MIAQKSSLRKLYPAFIHLDLEAGHPRNQLNIHLSPLLQDLLLTKPFQSVDWVESHGRVGQNQYTLRCIKEIIGGRKK